MAENTSVTVQKPPIVVLRERLEARHTEIRAALTDIPPDRFIRAVITAAQINPDILACHWNSVWLACMRACRDGLLPDGIEGAIVPYGKGDSARANWIPMYRGLLRKFQQSGSFRWITANVVRAGEDFEHYIDERGEHFRHVPGDDGDAPVVKVYAMATTKDGGVFVSVLSMAEINKIRRMSRASREDAPWNQWPEEMMKKTALRRLSKLLPTAPLPEEERDDDEPEAESPVRLAASTPRPHGAAAALDAFAGEPEIHETSHEASASEDQAKPPSVPTDAGDGGVQAAENIAASHSQQSAAATDNVTVAYLRGKEAKAAKHARAALPGEYRSSARDAEAEAWLAGYDGKPKPGANP